MASTSTAQRVNELGGLPREQLVELFLQLPAPDPGELFGELDGFTPEYLARLFAASAADDGLGTWYGKGFAAEPIDGWDGTGYNVWGIDGETVRSMRFGWRRATSILDGGACIAVEYRAFANGYADLDLADEIRRLEDGLYLGIATTDGPSRICPDAGGPNGRSLPTTFLLRGPAKPCVGVDDPAGELRPVR